MASGPTAQGSIEMAEYHEALRQPEQYGESDKYLSNDISTSSTANPYSAQAMEYGNNYPEVNTASPSKQPADAGGKVQSLDKDRVPEAIPKARHGQFRSIVRACAMNFCTVVVAINIVEYSVVIQSGDDFFIGPDVLLGVPLCLVAFFWEFADICHFWRRGHGIHPVAHIVVEMLLGLASAIAIGFTAYYLAESVIRAREHGPKKYVGEGPEAFMLAMLLCLMVCNLTLFGLALKDNKNRSLESALRVVRATQTERV